jgi:hypothetical protein
LQKAPTSMEEFVRDYQENWLSEFW